MCSNYTQVEHSMKPYCVHYDQSTIHKLKPDPQSSNSEHVCMYCEVLETLCSDLYYFPEASLCTPQHANKEVADHDCIHSRSIHLYIYSMCSMASVGCIIVYRAFE